MSELTGILAEIAEAAGETAALLIAREYGGTRLYIPDHIMRGHRLAQLLGQGAADKVAAAMGGREYTIPLGPCSSLQERRRRQAQMERAGLSAREIARALGVVERTAYRNRARMRRDGQTPDLFGPREGETR